VRGGNVYGSFPFPALGGPDDANNRGVWIPTISTSQFGATLGKWFGASPAELAAAFSAATRESAHALLVTGDPMYFGVRGQIAELGARSRLPLMTAQAEITRAGGLIAYEVDQRDIFRRAATYVDKIFKGARPADLPVEQPNKFEMVINLKTAKLLGLTIPHALLLRADEVIQ